ncbi:MAG: class I SAM-dependent methyltransferase [Candidatus Omnitrophota bacterium]
MDKVTVLEEAYRCVQCLGNLHMCDSRLVCEDCQHQFEVRDGIPIFAEKERYWCNVPKEKMKELNADAISGNWKDAVRRHLKGNVIDHVGSEKRIDFRYILPCLKDKKVLDIGSMWGGVAAPLSRYAKEVYAMDTTYETLQFLSVRTKQDKIDNMKIALGSAHKLPFSDNSFDIVLLIGVLEWLGSDSDFVLTEHYGKARETKPPRPDSPTSLQMKALSEIHRVLKEGGTALIAIENRYFYKHFFGFPDPHTAMSFSSIMPRWMADIYMRITKNQDYSEYTHSYNGYKKILKRVGFKSSSFYAASPSYRELDVIIPLDSDRQIKYYYGHYGLRGARGIKRLIPLALTRFNLMKHFVPSYLITVEK